MGILEKKFAKIGTENAPGQEIRRKKETPEIIGEYFRGDFVDFSHGDVDAFPPTPGAFEAFSEGFFSGTRQAYTEYRGDEKIRQYLAGKLAEFSGAPVDKDEIILTPGTQGALFLAMGSLVTRGTKVAVVEPDYFANRKLAAFFEGKMYPVPLDYMKGEEAGLDLEALEAAFKDGVKVFLFSNPNNPTGAIYSRKELEKIAELAGKYEAAVIVDELYSRQIYDKKEYTHLRALKNAPKNLITIIGPSKTESLSGFRLGAAYGSKEIIERMEKLQAIATLRAPGYGQRVFYIWFSEPKDFLKKRTSAHRAIRNEIMKVLDKTKGVSYRKTDGGSYLFINLPKLTVDINTFVKVLKVQADLVVTPGTEFGPGFTHHIRINFSQDRKKAVAAIKRAMKALDYYRDLTDHSQETLF